MSFQKQLKEEFIKFSVAQQAKFPPEETLRIDLHCHDYHSDVPDELIGRILNVPETWISSEQLVQELKNNRCNAFTITNHNNADSCYELQNKGFDILTGAEFSCWVPDYDLGIHVLAYGFTAEQEAKLKKLRKNIYHFQEFALKQNIPTVWAHPLYHYSVKNMPPIDFFNKMSLIFERFEVFNGQRDTWQNILVKEWIGQLNDEKIEAYQKQFGINPSQFCKNVYKKVLTGGSDSHMGLFAGTTGSYLYIQNLKDRLKNEARSNLALEAIREGNIAPYGTFQNSEKLTIAFLQYVCQVAINYNDPGLLRLLLHKGEQSDKIISFVASNLFSEMQQHKVTMSFVRLFNDSLMGKIPSFYKKMLVSKPYKPVFTEAVKIAKAHKKNKVSIVDEYTQSIDEINALLNKLLFKRLRKKIDKTDFNKFDLKGFDKIIEKLELPISLRAYTEKKNKDGVNVSKFLDGLSFPFLASVLLLSAHFTSSKVLYNTRPFLKSFSKQLGKFEHPEKILWLTDTFGDKNGVSAFLKEVHRYIVRNNLPIDIVTCSSKLKTEKNLIVVKPIGEFTAPMYEDQKMCFPNILEIHNLFLEGEYDRVICSTEGIMGLCGLYLKHAYSVEASFYMHTDWLTFARKVLNIHGQNLSRVRRMLRFFYKSFDKVFVLNSEHREWLTGSQMNLEKNRVYQTAHWVSKHFKPYEADKKNLFQVSESIPVLLYVGRVSKEKGALEIPYIFEKLKLKHKDAKVVIVGEGPALKELKKSIPDGIFINWVEQRKLAQIYSSADILVLPSKFDTFCNVVLEALSCGLPVVAYNRKGPKDIILNDKTGYLVSNKDNMAKKIIEFFSLPDVSKIKKNAVQRAKLFTADGIMRDFMNSVGIKTHE